MAGMRSFGEWRRGEAEKLRELSWKKRLEYLFVYYKGWFAGFLILLLFLGYAVDVVVQGQKEIALQGFFTNDTHNAFPTGEIAEELSSRLSLDRNQRIIFDDDLYIDLEGEATQYTAASNGKIIAYMAVGELDFVVTSGEVYRHFAGDIPMRDLSELLPEDLYRQLAPAIADAPDQHGAPIPSAIELSGSRFLRDREDLPEGSYYLFVPHSVPHGEAVCEFIRYCFE